MTTRLTLMFSAVLCVALMSLPFPISSADACGDTMEFTHKLTLDAAKEYTVNYKVDEEDEKLILRLRAKHTGYLGFGFSETGFMAGADIVTVSMSSSGEPSVIDRFADWDAHPFAGPTPHVDKCNQWETLCASEENGYTDFVISRPLDTQDSEDRAIKNGAMPVIFAWGESDTFVYHGANRGSTRIAFFSDVKTEFEVPAESDGFVEAFINNYSLGSDKTQYVLQKIDIGPETRHIIAIEPFIRDEDKEFAHHIVIHDCGVNEATPPLNFLPLNTPINVGGISVLGIGACTGMVSAWGKGGKAFMFPTEAGVRAGSDGVRYIVVEFHLDVNRIDAKGSTIASGVKLYTSTKLREHDVGTIIFGDATVRFDPIKAGTELAHYESSCPVACTSTFDGPIQVFHAFPHMHSFGRQIWATKYDENNEPTVIAYKQFWNFGFQDQLDGINVTITGKDRVNTHCVYDASKASSDVKFSTGSNDEMCMVFTLYFPKKNAGLNCGYKSPTETVCRNGVVLDVPNPYPSDGQTTVPESLALGDPPETCPSWVRRISDQQMDTTSSSLAAPSTAAPTTIRLRARRLQH
jgi:hypothetical protein